MLLGKKNSLFKTFSISIFLASIAILAFTVIKSGYFFEFDIDELYHVNTSYLIGNGSIPFKDFFLPYSPLFHIFLLPLFSAFGYTLDTIQLSRVVMIILFAIRIIGIAFIARMLFGTLTALLFIPLFLMDPFTEFISMQIRPDNFMMTIYILALVSLVQGLLHKKKISILLSGILLAASLLISIKILPSVAVVFLVLIVLRFKHKFQGLSELLLGFSIPLFLFGLYYAMTGLLAPMVTNIIFDARAINESLKYPVPMGNFYWPSPSTTFGLSFKPILFQYLWSLPLLAFAGAYHSLLNFDFSFSKYSSKQALIVILVLALTTQWLSLFFIRSVFIQYYIPITWLFALFGAVALASLFLKLEANKVFYGASLLFFGAIYVYYLIPSIQANTERAKATGTETKAILTSIWNHIPENSAVYPGVIFRPLAYPIPYGFTYYDLPKNLFRRYNPIETYLQKNNVQYLNIQGRPWALPNEGVKQYVNTHYVQEKEHPMFWKKK